MIPALVEVGKNTNNAVERYRTAIKERGDFCGRIRSIQIYIKYVCYSIAGSEGFTLTFLEKKVGLLK